MIPGVVCAATMTSPPLELAVDIPGLEIPGGYLSAIPSLAADTSASRFCFHVMQEQKGTLVSQLAETSFSTLPPSGTCNLSELAKQPIPPTKYIQSLKKYLGNLPNNTRLSFRSIRDPTNHNELLPLWVLTVWDKVSSLIDSRNRWIQSNSWVKRLEAAHQEGEDTRLALAHFKVLGWSSRISLYGLRGITNLSLTQFLSDNCIDGEAIDLMARFLSSRPTLPVGVLIFDLRLSNFLSKISSQAVLDRPSPPHIQELENQLTRTNTLYFPSFHEKYKHWVAFKVDLLHRDVVYGMLLCY